MLETHSQINHLLVELTWIIRTIFHILQSFTSNDIFLINKGVHLIDTASHPVCVYDLTYIIS